MAVPGTDAVYRFAAGLAFGIMRAQRWQFDIQGLQNVPTTGGAVIACNHTGFWDYFTAGYGPYHQIERPIRILAKESLFRTPVFGRMMQRAKHIPVHRGSGTDALSSAVAALKAGELVLVLPEQTISWSFELLPFKTGAARMAAAAGVPLIPTVSWGSHRFHTAKHPIRAHWKLPVTVAYGEPLHPELGDDPEVVTQELFEHVEALSHRVQETYPERPAAGEPDWWVPARMGGSAPTHDEAQRLLAEFKAQWRAKRERRAS